MNDADAFLVTGGPRSFGQRFASRLTEGASAARIVVFSRDDSMQTEDLAAGELVDNSNIVAPRTGTGLPPSERPETVGLRVRRTVEHHEPVTWGVVR